MLILRIADGEMIQLSVTMRFSRQPPCRLPGAIQYATKYDSMECGAISSLSALAVANLFFAAHYEHCVLTLGPASHRNDCAVQTSVAAEKVNIATNVVITHASVPSVNLVIHALGLTMLSVATHHSASRPAYHPVFLIASELSI